MKPAINLAQEFHDGVFLPSKSMRFVNLDTAEADCRTRTFPLYHVLIMLIRLGPEPSLTLSKFELLKTSLHADW